MPRATVNIAEPSGQAITDTTWRFAVGYIPGEANLGLVGEAQGGSPARLTDYDDSGWEICNDLPARVSGGFTFAWYRATVTIPETINGHPTAGMRVQFETCVDDYGEIWIDGECNPWHRPGLQRFAASSGNRQCPTRGQAHHRRPCRQRPPRRPLRHGVRALRPARFRVVDAGRPGRETGRAWAR